MSRTVNTKRIYSMLLASFLLILTSCSMEESKNYEWKAGSASWEAEADFDNLSMYYNEQLFTISLTYKGTLEQFQKLKRVQLHQGNANYTSSVLFLDASLKDEITNEGMYREYAIRFVDFSEADTPELEAQFPYVTALELGEPFERYIAENGHLLLFVSWGENQFVTDDTERIDLKAN